MGLKGISLILLTLAAYSQAAAPENPMVAFMCNKPAMYLTDNGWVEDHSTDCKKESDEILEYCRKVYPDKQVTNVVEASEKVTISHWCGFDRTKCHEHNSHEVRPFRCLVGPFQSDALLVPEHCLFDHKHGEPCQKYDLWKATAVDACQAEGRAMKLESFAILQPCGVMEFNGVEFVCCPKKDIASTTTTTTTTEASAEVKPEQEKSQSEEDFFAHYLQKAFDDRFMNEHQYFDKAKGNLQKHHHERVTKMMKEWASARQRVQDMNDVDPKGAEKLNREITARFQKTYEALEQEGMAEKKQLVALHQQRVQADLNEKKRHAMEHYMEVLANNDADAGRILKALKHYIKAEQKDRMHTVNHYKHLQDTDPDQASSIRQQCIDHLNIIDQRVQQAIDMLNRVQNLEKKIRTQIDNYLKTFHEIDVAIADLLVDQIQEPTDKQIVEQYKEDLQEPAEDDDAVEEPTPELKDVDEDDKDDVDEDEEYYDEQDYEDEDYSDEDQEEYNAEESEEKAASSPVKPSNIDEALPIVDDEEDEEDEHYNMAQPQVEAAAHIGENKLEVNMYEKKNMNGNNKEKKDASNLYGGYTFGIAVAAIAVFVILVVGIVVLRKKNARTASNHGFVEVDQAASPEEKHVANMQMNGYENPTYRYFEMNTSNA